MRPEPKGYRVAADIPNRLGQMEDEKKDILEVWMLLNGVHAQLTLLSAHSVQKKAQDHNGDQSKLRTQLRNLKLTFRLHALNEDDSILIFDSLSRFMNETKLLNMLEAKAFEAIPTFLNRKARLQLKENLS